MKRIGKGGVAILIAIALGAAMWWPEKLPLLLERSIRIAKIPTGEIPYGTQNLEMIPRPSGEVLLVTTSAGSHPLKVVDGMAVSALHLFRVDPKAGGATRQPKLEKALTEWPWFGLRVSPDGKYLICQRGDARRKARLIDLQTGAVQILDLEQCANVAWVPDSSGFYSFTYDGPREILSKARRYKLADLAKPEHLTVSPPLAWGMSSSAWGPPPAVAPDGTMTVLACYQETQTHPWHMTIRAQRFKREGNRLNRIADYRFDPPDMLIPSSSVKVSPDGRRILWHGTRQDSQTAKSWRLYTSKLDGSDLRMVGGIPLANDPFTDGAASLSLDSQPIPAFFGAEWLSDGRIVFAADGGIYTVDPN